MYEHQAVAIINALQEANMAEIMLGIIGLYILFELTAWCLAMIVNMIGYLILFLLWLLLYICRACWKWSWALPKLMGRPFKMCCLWIGRKILAIAVFSYFLVSEFIRGDATRQNYSDGQYDSDQDAWASDPYEKQKTHHNPYEKALRLLGLPAGCTQKMLEIAFRKAMEAAHPDKGGSHELALAVNAARNTIKTHHGWR